MKKELRARLRAVLDAMTPAARQAQSLQAAVHLFAEREYLRAEIIMIYLSLPQEADTTPLVLQAWKDRKRIVAPQISWESKRMIPVQISNLDTDITDTPNGVREPVRGTPLPIELIDLVIVPGLGFDPQGNRLGRGRGCYDRFLSRPGFKGVTCGFAFEEQVVDSIPSKPHDVKVKMLVTDRAVRRFAKRRAGPPPGP
ncbi:MAG: 5-formyltetrahydrofolate cyclo-ligase [Phycisphaerae bacterium]